MGPDPRRLPYAAGALLAGVLAVQYAPELPSRALLLALAVLGFAAAAWRRTPWPAAFALGVAMAQAQAAAVLADRLDPALAGTVAQVSGVVASVPLREPGRLRFDFAPEAVRWPAGARLPTRIRVSWYGEAPALRPGERWYLSLKLRVPRGLANPVGGSTERRLAIDGIGATAYVHDETAPARLGDTRRFPVERARAAVAAAIERAVGASAANGLVQALAVGVQDAVPDEQWTLFRRTGLVHLVAISGLHVTLFAVLVAGAVRLAFRSRALARWQRARLPAESALGLAAATAYALLAGWSVPTQRTVLMLGVYAAARLARRPLAAGDLFALALVAVLLHDPLASLTAGFWLSFGAVGAILAVGTARRRAYGAVAGFGVTQAAVTVALLPASALFVGGLTWVGAFANAVAIPAYSFVVVPLVLLATAAWPFAPPLAEAAWRSAAWLLDLQWVPLERLAALPGVGWSPVPPGPVLLAAGVAAVAAVLAPLPRAVRGLGLVVLGALLAARAERPPPGSAWVTVLDVGQGLAAVVETRTRVLVYDTGPAYPGGGSAAESVLVPFLAARGWRRVDVLVVSHGDLDHAGGREALRAALPIGRELSGEPTAPARCRTGQSWRYDGVRFAIVHPADASSTDDNAGSCVLRVTTGRSAALFTGDIPAAVEAALPPAALAADLVLVPHHGSRTSSSPALVGAAGARWAVVAAGHANRWGFPRPDVVARWRAAGAEVVETAVRGALRFELDARGARARGGERDAKPRWWLARGPPRDRG